MTRQERRLVIAGTMLIGVSYGLARFAYGLFLPSMRDDVGLSSAAAGIIASGAYVGYCVAIVTSALLVERLGARRMAVAAALIAAGGMAVVAVSTSAIWLAGGILFAGLSTGLASPPMAQAVSSAVPVNRQGRANTVVNAGTSLGVAVSGPVAFLATGQWRIAYAVFAVAALLNALLLLISVPRANAGGDRRRDVRQQVHGGGPRRPRALVLIAAATGMGMASAAFWTFSSDVILTRGHLDQGVANVTWIVIGMAGLAGAAAGDLIDRLGLNIVHRGTLAMLALSLWLLVLSPSNLPMVFVSAGLFGAAYIMLTGVYLVWGVRLYADRPAIGLGLPFLMIAIGQVIGSPLAGYLIGSAGYTVCFVVFAVIALATMLAGYHSDRQGNGTEPSQNVSPRTDMARPPSPPTPRFYMPAMPPLWLIEKIGRRLGGWLGARTDRR